jgi:hypothetical protein
MGLFGPCFAQCLGAKAGMRGHSGCHAPTVPAGPRLAAPAADCCSVTAGVRSPVHSVAAPDTAAFSLTVPSITHVGAAPRIRLPLPTASPPPLRI